MKIVVMISRILMGLVFAFFGANMLFHFLNPPLPSGPVKDFTTVLQSTHYDAVVGFFQVVPGLLLLVNRYVPLALTVLAAQLLNILTTHILVMGGNGLPIPLVVVIMWIIVFWSVRPAFAGIFQQRGAE